MSVVPENHRTSRKTFTVDSGSLAVLDPPGQKRAEARASTQIRAHHPGDHLVEPDGGGPAEPDPRPGGIAGEFDRIDRPDERRIHPDVALPVVDPGGPERGGDELGDRV